MTPDVAAILDWATVMLWVPIGGLWWQFVKLNGRLIRQEQWAVSHEMSDRTSMQNIDTRLTRMDSNIDRVHQRFDERRT